MTRKFWKDTHHTMNNGKERRRFRKMLKRDLDYLFYRFLICFMFPHHTYIDILHLNNYILFSKRRKFGKQCHTHPWAKEDFTLGPMFSGAHTGLPLATPLPSWWGIYRVKGQGKPMLPPQLTRMPKKHHAAQYFQKSKVSKLKSGLPAICVKKKG